ncbi:MAG: hypothetical protein LBV47_06075 [Bacteroidales bacterium]|jgi:hypothetical protein|nr:hypothetical protein [Bacteroidales bacterium]
MLNIGLIGKTEILEPHVKKFQRNPDINIIGKASIGANDSLNSFHYQIPEINRNELIELVDVIIIDNSSKHTFQLLCDIVKKSKHIFIVEYLNLTVEECLQLIKLSNESRSVIQVTNLLCFNPAIQWLSQHLINPAYIDIACISSEIIADNTLVSLLFVLLGVVGKSPKKIEAVAFSSEQADSNFNNVRLEYDDASVVTLNYGKMPQFNKFKIKVYSSGMFVILDFANEIYLNNSIPFTIDSVYAVNEPDYFINTIIKKCKQLNSIEDYLAVLNVVQKINKKISQFSL